MRKVGENMLRFIIKRYKKILLQIYFFSKSVIINLKQQMNSMHSKIKYSVDCINKSNCATPIIGHQWKKITSLINCL